MTTARKSSNAAVNTEAGAKYICCQKGLGWPLTCHFAPIRNRPEDGVIGFGERRYYTTEALQDDGSYGSSIPYQRQDSPDILERARTTCTASIT